MAGKVGKQPLVNRILMYLLILVLIVYAAVQIVGLFSKDVEIARLRGVYNRGENHGGRYVFPQ